LDGGLAGKSAVYRQWQRVRKGDLLICRNLYPDHNVAVALELHTANVTEAIILE
jgi:hypothetical protein